MYSIRSNGACTMHSPFRQLYAPKPDRLPTWLRKLWLWF